MNPATDKAVTFALAEEAIPTSWYNATADLPFSPPPLIHPGTKQPLDEQDLAAIFPRSPIRQEMTRDRFVEIPGAVRDVYRLWRPTPLRRSRRFEQALGTRCRIYFKDESTSPVGSHKHGERCHPRLLGAWKRASLCSRQISYAKRAQTPWNGSKIDGFRATC